MLSYLDLDECTTGSHSCDVNSVCQNAVGSYTCSCNAGYTGDGKPCNGILNKAGLRRSVSRYKKAERCELSDFAYKTVAYDPAKTDQDVGIVSRSGRTQPITNRGIEIAVG